MSQAPEIREANMKGDQWVQKQFPIPICFVERKDYDGERAWGMEGLRTGLKLRRMVEQGHAPSLRTCLDIAEELARNFLLPFSGAHVVILWPGPLAVGMAWAPGSRRQIERGMAMAGVAAMAAGAKTTAHISHAWMVEPTKEEQERGLGCSPSQHPHRQDCLMVWVFTGAEKAGAMMRVARDLQGKEWPAGDWQEHIGQVEAPIAESIERAVTQVHQGLDKQVLSILMDAARILEPGDNARTREIVELLAALNLGAAEGPGPQEAGQDA